MPATNVGAQRSFESGLKNSIDNLRLYGTKPGSSTIVLLGDAEPITTNDWDYSNSYLRVDKSFTIELEEECTVNGIRFREGSNTLWELPLEEGDFIEVPAQGGFVTFDPSINVLGVIYTGPNITERANRNMLDENGLGAIVDNIVLWNTTANDPVGSQVSTDSGDFDYQSGGTFKLTKGFQIDLPDGGFIDEVRWRDGPNTAWTIPYVLNVPSTGAVVVYNPSTMEISVKANV